MVYLPDLFDASDPDEMREIIDRFPLATMVTQGPDGLSADHIPLILEADCGPHGTLIGHVARKNDLWREGHHEGETLVVFQAIDAYISPNWYPTKGETHKAVPTWNYAVVHAYGPLVIHEDAKWLRGVCGKLTRKMEAITSERPWKMADAPREYIDGMLADIVGIEIPLTRLIGKTKASQNREMVDREGAAAGLRARGDAASLAMAELIEESAKR